MTSIRKIAAIVALGVLGMLVLTPDSGFSGRGPSLASFELILLAVLAVIGIGLTREAMWSRWVALGSALALIPWALVVTFALPGTARNVRSAVLLSACLTLIFSLSGAAMVQRYDGKAWSYSWSSRVSLVRWTIVLNIASVVGLLLFVALYRTDPTWHAAIPAVLLGTLASGVVLLGCQKTLGLLLVVGSSVLFVPAGTYFVWKEASHVGEAYLFGACFVPGIIAGGLCLLAFGRPIWSVLSNG